MSMIEVCSFIPSASAPVFSPTLSPAITRSPANYYDASTSCINNDSGSVKTDDGDDDSSSGSVAGTIISVVVMIIFIGIIMSCVYYRWTYVRNRYQMNY